MGIRGLQAALLVPFVVGVAAFGSSADRGLSGESGQGVLAPEGADDGNARAFSRSNDVRGEPASGPRLLPRPPKLVGGFAELGMLRLPHCCRGFSLYPLPAPCAPPLWTPIVLSRRTSPMLP